jgi:hypothetical protein
MEKLVTTAVFVLFALLATAGAYLVLARQRGRAAGLWGAFATLLFFAALFAGVLCLLRSGGVV